MPRASLSEMIATIYRPSLNGKYYTAALSCHRIILLIRNYELLIRNYELLIRNYELLIRNYQLVIRNYELRNPPHFEVQGVYIG